MRVIIAGSRICSNIQEIEIAVKQSGFLPSVILSGAAKGVDKLGELWASTHKISIEKYPADWEKYGKSAGYKRNEIMANAADALIAIWDGKSKGTKHMIATAKRKGLKTHIHIFYQTKGS